MTIKKEETKKPIKTTKKSSNQSSQTTKKHVLLAALATIIILGLSFLIYLITNKPITYVFKHGLEVLSAKNIYSNPVFTYTTDTKGEILDIGLKFEGSSASFRFYDYDVSEPDDEGNVIISFKYDTTVPIKFTRENYDYKDKYYYTYSIIRPILFDKYTGNEYRKYTIRSDSDEEKRFKHNETTLNGKTYKIGIRAETISIWDCKKQESKDTYTDTNKVTTTIYISAPKDYDGMMIAILKEGATEFLQINQEDDQHTLLSHDGKSYSANDFYVFAINDIKPIE